MMRQPSLMYWSDHGEMLPWMDLWVYGDSRVFYFQRLGVQQVQEKVLQIAWLLEPGDYQWAQGAGSQMATYYIDLIFIHCRF